MPEGDTIWRTAAGLRARIVGKTVRSARPGDMSRLQGSTVVAVEPAGKHLLMRFDSGLVLHSHMRMTGSWHVYQPGQAWRKPARAARVVLGFDDTEAVLFSAPVVELLRDGERAVAHLGPDILAPEFDLEEVVRRARQVGALSLGELLLEQRVCAGIGNVYKCEALWALKADPWQITERTDEAELRELFLAARRFMRENLGGFDRRFAGRPHAVHGCKGRPCPRCGSPIRTRAQGDLARLTYYCPHCQHAAMPHLTRQTPAGNDAEPCGRRVGMTHRCTQPGWVCDDPPLKLPSRKAG